MKSKKKLSASERPVFDAIRKPLAPPSKTISRAKSDAEAQPAQRKAKHKGQVKEMDNSTIYEQ